MSKKEFQQTKLSSSVSVIIEKLSQIYLQGNITGNVLNFWRMLIIAFLCNGFQSARNQIKFVTDLTFSSLCKEYLWKYFYRPGQKYYKSSQINEELGDFWVYLNVCQVFTDDQVTSNQLNPKTLFRLFLTSCFLYKQYRKMIHMKCKSDNQA